MFSYKMVTPFRWDQRAELWPWVWLEYVLRTNCERSVTAM